MNSVTKQECLPVGCVPAAHWPYAGVCYRGGSLVWGGGSLVWGGLPGPGESAWLGASLVPRGLASQHALRQSPPLRTESQTPVKTLPLPNFIAAGKNCVIKMEWACHLLCKRPGSCHRASKTHSRGKIFKVSIVHAAEPPPCGQNHRCL